MTMSFEVAARSGLFFMSVFFQPFGVMATVVFSCAKPLEP
jgi:hypothetical protein